MPLKKLQEYKSAEEYKIQQAAKTAKPSVRKHFGRKYKGRLAIFKERLSYLFDKGFTKKGWQALCLGARLGEEVDALNQLGVEAIGVDLVACPEHNVIEGDFMDLRFVDGTFDIVYTNSADHALDMEKFLSQAHRVLKHKGFLILDIFPEGNNVGPCEVYELDVFDIIEILVKKHKMELIFLDAKLRRLYKFNHHKETQVILRKGTGC